MNKENNKKYILISDSQWRKLKTEAQINESKYLNRVEDRNTRIQKNFSSHQANMRDKEDDRKFNQEKIREFIARTQRIFQNEKLLPNEIKRAVYLCNIFTEKENQLKFRKILQQLREEHKNKENQRIKREEEINRNLQLEREKKLLLSKRLLAKHLQNDLSEMKVRQKMLEDAETIAQRIELENVEKQLKEYENEEKRKNFEKKNKLKDTFLKDLCEKKQYHELIKNIEEEENKRILIQSMCIEKNKELINREQRRIRNETLKKILKNQPMVPVCLYSNKLKPIVKLGKKPRLLILEKSEIEKKREEYSKSLKKERIRMYEEQMREFHRRQINEKHEKNAEFECRMLNLDVTSSFLNQKKHDNINKVNLYRTIWNKQCEEKKLAKEKEKLEDKKRLEKLCNDMNREDKEFLRSIKSILDEYVKQEKNTLPLIKCIRDFEKNRLLKFKPRNKIWFSQVQL